MSRARWGVILVMSLTLVAPVATPLQAAAPSAFTLLPDPVGLAGRFDFFFATNRCSDALGARILSKIDRAGAVSTFATLFPRVGCFDELIAVSPGLGSFADARNFVYVTQGRQLVEIDAAGASVRTFFKFPGSVPDTGNGIFFDWVGTWNFDVLVVGGSQVWRLRRETSSAVCDSMGLAAPCGVPVGSPFPVVITSRGKPVAIGGPPAIVPTTFATCPGGLLVASETFMGGSVFCVRANGTVHGPVALWPGARGVHFIPPNPCPFGTTDESPPAGTFFTTLARNGKIIQFPTTDFTASAKLGAGLDGRAALVSSATGAGIGLMNPPPPAPPALLPVFFNSLGEHQGSDFCGRHRVRIKVLEAKDGRVRVAILSRPGFDPRGRVNCGPGLRFGRIGNEVSFVSCTDSKDDVNRDGVADLTVLFDLKASGVRSGDRTWLTGFFKPNSPDEGFAGGD